MIVMRVYMCVCLCVRDVCGAARACMHACVHVRVMWYGVVSERV